MSLPAEPRVVITGAGGGLGRAFGVVLAARRGRLILADINIAAAEETCHLVERCGGKAVALRCDVSRIEDVSGLVDAAGSAFGGADLVINNAGVAVGGPLEDIPVADWEWSVGVNLMGVVNGCRAFLPGFKALRAGYFLNVASAVALLAVAEMAPYFATKAGVIALSESLAAELHGTGIGTTVLCPTFFPSGLGHATRGHGAMRERLPALMNGMMRRATLTTEDVVRRALTAVDRGQLYALPNAEGRWMWRIKRMAPELVQGVLVPRAVALARRLFFT